MGKKKLLFHYYQVQEAMNVENNTSMNFNQVLIYLIQERTMTSQLIENIYVETVFLQEEVK